MNKIFVRLSCFVFIIPFSFFSLLGVKLHRGHFGLFLAVDVLGFVGEGLCWCISMGGVTRISLLFGLVCVAPLVGVHWFGPLSAVGGGSAAGRGLTRSRCAFTITLKFYFLLLALKSALSNYE